MRCPACQDLENKVVDSRLSKDGLAIRRRRECSSCGRRFTTYERIEEQLPLVVKKDGRREPFARLKIIEGLKKAFQKRSVSIEEIEALADDLTKEFSERGDKEVAASVVGERIMERLKEMDEVAYVRFASVYRSFRDVTHFMEELQELLAGRKADGGATPDGPAGGTGSDG
jgi:transcriptional repressor NrdR